MEIKKFGFGLWYLNDGELIEKIESRPQNPKPHYLNEVRTKFIKYEKILDRTKLETIKKLEDFEGKDAL
jgi:hypothetical protein